MTDFPRNIAVPTHINTYSRWMNGNIAHTIASTGNIGTMTWTANAAVYIPMFLPWPYVLRRFFWVHGTSASTNFDIGVFSKTGVKLASTGSTANSTGASIVQYAAPTAEILLMPGKYWIGYSNAGTTNQVGGSLTSANTGRLIGMYQEASAFPLPAQATFGAYVGAHQPALGITNTDTGF